MIGEQKTRRPVLHAPGVPCCCPTYGMFASSSFITNHVTMACRHEWWQEHVGNSTGALIGAPRGYPEVRMFRDDGATNCRFACLDGLFDIDLEGVERFFDGGGRAIIGLADRSDYRTHFNQNAASIGMPEFWGESFLGLGSLRTEVIPYRYRPFACATGFTGTSSITRDVDGVYYIWALEISGGTPLLIAPDDEMWGDVAGKPILSVSRVGNGFAIAAAYCVWAGIWSTLEWKWDQYGTLLNVPPGRLLDYPAPGNSQLIRNFISARADEIAT